MRVALKLEQSKNSLVNRRRTIVKVNIRANVTYFHVSHLDSSFAMGHASALDEFIAKAMTV
jgi:hypothetical protein